MKLERENELHLEDIISIEDFKVSAFQWRYKKKLDKFLERLQNKIVEKNTGNSIDKTIKLTIE